MRKTFRFGLKFIVPQRGSCRVLEFYRENIADMLLREVILLLIREIICFGRTIFKCLSAIGPARGESRSHGLSRNHLMRRIHHKTEYFIDGKSRSQVQRACFVVKAPVLIRQELPGALKIAENAPVPPDHLTVRGTDHRPALVFKIVNLHIV